MTGRGRRTTTAETAELAASAHLTFVRIRRSASWLLIATVFLAAAASASADDIPYLTGRVVDDAGIMSASTRAHVTAMLEAHEQATGNQIVVLTVPTIQPDSIEEYAVKVFEAWKLGQKGKDNGVLVVVVPQDRKMRIEVGYGLEPTLTDGWCGAIIRNVMTPRFRTGDYSGGIDAGVAAIVARLNGGNRMPEAPRPAPTTVHFNQTQMEWPMRILMGVFVFSIIGLFTAIGVMTPGVGWFLYVFLIPFWALFPMAIIGPQPALFLLAAYVVGYPLGKIALSRTEWYRNAANSLKTKGTASIGGFTFAAGPGFSSGGFSGGGFSGGGGSSGGGGASGSW
jgi:uncharacterized protein